MRRAAGGLALVLAALIASGCGTVGVSRAGQGDTARGKDLFVQKCGQCHVLADAGTKGTIGPNLDAAFEQSRRDGLGDTTIQSVVRGQIAYPVEEPPTGAAGMPADIVTGDDAEAVAAYVATVAARAPAGGAAGGGTTTGGTESSGGSSGGGSSADGEAADGEAVFASAGCGSCHTFQAAGASGTVGPNLDEAKPSLAIAKDRIRNGRGAMPAFEGQLSDAEIDAVAEYVSASG